MDRRFVVLAFALLAAIAFGSPTKEAAAPPAAEGTPQYGRTGFILGDDDLDGPRAPDGLPI